MDPSCFLLGKCWKSENSQDRLRGDLHKVRHSSRFCLVTDLLRLFFLLQRYRQTVALSNVDLAKIYTQSTIEVYRRGVIDWVIYQPRSQGSLLLALRSEREREREPGKRWSRGSRTSELPENLESKTSVVAGLTDDTNLRSWVIYKPVNFLKVNPCMLNFCTKSFNREF